MKTRVKGFTLVETMIVVAIICIILAIALPYFFEAGKKAKATISGMSNR